MINSARYFKGGLARGYFGQKGVHIHTRWLGIICTIAIPLQLTCDHVVALFCLLRD
jgi:hypothetical protein